MLVFLYRRVANKVRPRTSSPREDLLSLAEHFGVAELVALSNASNLPEALYRLAALLLAEEVIIPDGLPLKAQQYYLPFNIFTYVLDYVLEPTIDSTTVAETCTELVRRSPNARTQINTTSFFVLINQQYLSPLARSGLLKKSRLGGKCFFNVIDKPATAIALVLFAKSSSLGHSVTGLNHRPAHLIAVAKELATAYQTWRRRHAAEAAALPKPILSAAAVQVRLIKLLKGIRDISATVILDWINSGTATPWSEERLQAEVLAPLLDSHVLVVRDGLYCLVQSSVQSGATEPYVRPHRNISKNAGPNPYARPLPLSEMRKQAGVKPTAPAVPSAADLAAAQRQQPDLPRQLSLHGPAAAPLARARLKILSLIPPVESGRSVNRYTLRDPASEVACRTIDPIEFENSVLLPLRAAGCLIWVGDQIKATVLTAEAIVILQGHLDALTTPSGLPGGLA